MTTPNDSTLPVLTGTPKQVAWAGDLRATYLARIDTARHLLADHTAHRETCDMLPGASPEHLADASRVLDLFTEYVSTATTARAVIDGPIVNPYLDGPDLDCRTLIMSALEPADRMRMRHTMRTDPRGYRGYPAARHGCPFHGPDLATCTC